MKILHVTRDFPPVLKGGISTVVGGLTDALLANGDTACVLSFDAWRPATRAQHPPDATPKQTSPADGLSVFRVRHPVELPEAAQHAKEFAPDVVHVHHSTMWSFAAEQLDGPKVFTTHILQFRQEELREMQRPTRSRLEQEVAIRSADAVTISTKSARQLLIQRYPDAQITVVPLGIELPEEPPGPGDTVLAVGRFADLKGTPTLFEVLRALARNGASAHVVGGIPYNPRAERRWRERWTAEATPAEQGRVVFSGWLTGTQLEAAYRDAGIFICPTHTETLCLAILEAMAHGLPVVATAVEGVVDVIEPGFNGFLSPLGDAEGITEHVLRLLADAPLRAQIGRNAREAAESTWSWSTVIGKWIELYQGLVV